MATVRFSKELTTYIVRNARNKMDPAVVRAKSHKVDPAWGHRIYDTLFGDCTPVITQLPANWFKTLKGFTVLSIGGVSCNMDFTFTTPQPWPHTFPDNALVRRPNSYSEAIELHVHPAWEELRQEVQQYNERVSAARERQREFAASVEKICTTYATLAPALKAWPPLWELIPEDVKDTHRRIVQREKKDVVLTVDIDKLTVMSTVAKFGI